MRTRILWAAAVLLLAACNTTPTPITPSDADNLHARVLGAVADFKSTDPSIDRFFSTGHAYVVFPSITTGAIGIGGAYGKGEVYQGGKRIGYADVRQASVGAQLGGQRYGEVIFFQNDAAFAAFKSRELEFDARASAVAASKGAASTADYQRGVIVFTLPESGLMFQAAIGGQKFHYEPGR